MGTPAIDQLNFDSLFGWLNANQGVLAVLIFGASAAFAWFSGIISALRRRPRLKIEATPGPTLYAVVPTGRDLDGKPSHRTCISIYLHVANAGSAPTSIGNISVGFRWRAFSSQWIRHQCVALADFQAILREEGETKIYPFLTQKGFITGDSANTYLDIGEITNGVIYFEGTEAWGACLPLIRRGHAAIAVVIEDAFGGKHRQRVEVPYVSLQEARKYNPRFGESTEGARAFSESQPG
ncbi:hypothetical protein [Phenylobacterium sp.]|uniref:hypothetical protein n=1 Tax=Phenylobacterium sp. TaxID=1871053 RepID=UPI00286DA007|nr:hypothetical protein [Phenylobacterium sp.]